MVEARNTILQILAWSFEALRNLMVWFNCFGLFVIFCTPLLLGWPFIKITVLFPILKPSIHWHVDLKYPLYVCIEMCLVIVGNLFFAYVSLCSKMHCEASVLILRAIPLVERSMTIITQPGPKKLVNEFLGVGPIALMVYRVTQISLLPSFRWTAPWRTYVCFGGIVHRLTPVKIGCLMWLFKPFSVLVWPCFLEWWVKIKEAIVTTCAVTIAKQCRLFLKMDLT